jgi:hypothetical protein
MDPMSETPAIVEFAAGFDTRRDIKTAKPLTPTAPTTVPPMRIGTPPSICICSTVIAAGRPVLIVP